MNTVPAKRKKICAIYTRKSTDERLDMEFNTLDAQREACEAYITSQRSEGWRASYDDYDDGGYSGGTLERPALNRMLEDIKNGKVNIVVVYKIDRLTRSLTDFSKLVEIFDECNVTFVSVTQSFNTTTSMGRLTLNVLLSFAQFEREVSGERIRDKIAASKRKGMWMGGRSPLGYKIGDRRLEVETGHVEIVQHIFNRYIELKSAGRLTRELREKNFKSPERISKKGKPYGGTFFSKGLLYTILKNPVYIGKISRKGKIYDGLHDPIIERDKWDHVQNLLNDSADTYKTRASHNNPLSGLIFDDEGTRYTSTYTAKGKLKYRYYISQNLLQYKDHPKHLIARLPAQEIEDFIEHIIRDEVSKMITTENIKIRKFVLDELVNIRSYDLIRNVVQKVIIKQNKIDLIFNPLGLKELIKRKLDCEIEVLDTYSITEAYRTRRADKGSLIIEAPSSIKDKDMIEKSDTELKKIVQGIAFRELHFDGISLKDIAQKYDVSDNYVGQMIFESFKNSL